MSGCMREVMTLQVGHYANFVGAHWWNIQESSFVYNPSKTAALPQINHDVLFRAGENLQGEVTYTPRAIIFDLKGSLNTLKQTGVLYDLPECTQDIKWSGAVTCHEEEAPEKNEFLQDLEQNDTEQAAEDSGHHDDTQTGAVSGESSGCMKLYDLDSEVEVWSDYLATHLHPNTIHTFNEHTHNSTVEVFDVFGLGQTAVRRDMTAIDDKLHFFLEECDNLQGIHLLCDPYDGFGGVSSSLLQVISDEFSSKGILAVPVFPCNVTSQSQSHWVMNTVLCYDWLVAEASAVAPLSLSTNPLLHSANSQALPHLSYKEDLAYHSSAILAASFDTVSLPYRSRHNPSLLSHLTDALTPTQCKVLSLQSALPLHLTEGSTLTDTLHHHGNQLPWKPLTPLSQANQPVICQSVALQGIKSSNLKRAQDSRQKGTLEACDSVEELLSVYLSEKCQTTKNGICHIEEPCKIKPPYPNIFHEHLNSQGLVTRKPRAENVGVESVPVLTSLQCSPSVTSHLSDLNKRATKINIRTFHRWQEAGLEEDSWRDAVENILRQISCYDQSSDMM